VNGIETSVKKAYDAASFEVFTAVYVSGLQGCDIAFLGGIWKQCQELVTVMLCHILEDQNPQNIKYLKFRDSCRGEWWCSCMRHCTTRSGGTVV